MRGPSRGKEGREGDRKPYAVLDIETDGMNGPLLYWTAACECSDVLHTGTTAAGLWDCIMRGGGPGHGTQGGGWSRGHRSRDHVWWGHNAGEYDYKYLFDSIKAEAARPNVKITPIVRTDAMIGFRITASKHRTDLRDSFALLPASLASLAAQLAPELPKLDIGLADGVTFDPENAVHREYAERDVWALLAVLKRFRALLAEGFDGALPSWSAASTALRAWTRTLVDADHFMQPPSAGADLARAGYFGGHVHIASTAWHEDVTTIDANAMYAAAMRRGVPDGWAWPVRRYVRGRPGFYLCTVNVPAGSPFTFVPYRDPAGSLAWPTGTFGTVLDSATLEAARSRGVKVTVISGVVWARLSTPFAAFIDRVEVLEARGGAVKYVAKIMRNSLYGKFGTRPTRDDWVICTERPGPDYWPPADGSIEGLWVRRGAPLRAPYLMPHWAAWITAQARLALLELVEAVGAADVIYTDTDSVTAPAAAIEAAILAGRVTVSPAFGHVKIEHQYSRYRALAPKVTQGVEIDGTSVLGSGGVRRGRRCLGLGQRGATGTPRRRHDDLAPSQALQPGGLCRLAGGPGRRRGSGQPPPAAGPTAGAPSRPSDRLGPLAQGAAACSCGPGGASHRDGRLRSGPTGAALGAQSVTRAAGLDDPHGRRGRRVLPGP
jgi:hypothetical protein